MSANAPLSGRPQPVLEASPASPLPTRRELGETFLQKYGALDAIGWAPRRRFRFGYFRPSDIHEATVRKYVTPGCAWLDVGGGHSLFPENPRLARELVARCSLVVGVDPSPNIARNDFVHRRVQSAIEDYACDEQFDVATLRMVAEHVEHPARVVSALQRLVRPGGVAIIFTVNLWSPVTLVSRLTPFRVHHRIASLFWEARREDVFPVQYRMNTRRVLRRLFERHGFGERAFAYLDDLSAFGNVKSLNYVDLLAWRALTRVGLRYPETCLLGVYVKRAHGSGVVAGRRGSGESTAPSGSSLGEERS